MTILILDWETVHLHDDVWISHHRLRHRLFVERLGWDVPSVNGLEFDQFDTPAAKYILWVDDDNQARGMVRLIPTTQPYMVKSLWPDWLDGTLPEDTHIWEATRFGCDRDLPSALRRKVIIDLICACQSFGVANGIEKYLSVMPLCIFKSVISAAGCPVDLLTERRSMAGHPTAVAYIDVSEEILGQVLTQAGRPKASLDKFLPDREGEVLEISVEKEGVQGIFLALSYLQGEAKRSGYEKLEKIIRMAACEARAEKPNELV